MSRFSVDDSYQLFPPEMFIFPLSHTPIHMHTHFGGQSMGQLLICLCLPLLLIISPWLSDCTDRIAWKLQFYLGWHPCSTHSPSRKRYLLLFSFKQKDWGHFWRHSWPSEHAPGQHFCSADTRKNDQEEACNVLCPHDTTGAGWASAFSFAGFVNQGSNFHKYGLLLKLWHTCWWAGLAGDEKSKHFNFTRLHHFSSMSFKIGFRMDIRPRSRDLQLKGPQIQGYIY